MMRTLKQLQLFWKEVKQRISSMNYPKFYERVDEKWLTDLYSKEDTNAS